MSMLKVPAELCVVLVAEATSSLLECPPPPPPAVLSRLKETPERHQLAGLFATDRQFFLSRMYLTYKDNVGSPPLLSVLVLLRGVR